ncbi:MAG TPA: glycosyltransferase family 2 protein [Solirubrobacter sp.]|nr:glycosyltransferase family 2 protein [Solirubrobacter sp.]
MIQPLAAAVVLSRLARGRTRRPPLDAGAPRPDATISVVIPARDEAARIGPCLDGVLADPDVAEVLVVDDGSTDGTAELARARGARVVAAGEPLPGWVGKPWALQRGLEAASGDVVVSVDADTRPRPGLARALAHALADADLVTAGARFVCETAGERWLHPALLTTLVYRYGPPDASAPAAVSRLVINGQCTAVRREPLLAAGGYAEAAGHMTDDAAFGRALARRGWRLAFHDGGGLIAVDMHESAVETWREWGRSIALPGVTSPAWAAADVAVVWLTLGLPPLRVLARRAGKLDLALLALRVAMLAAVAPSYQRRGVPFWLSPLADPLAAARLTWSAVRPSRRWRDRAYAPRTGSR